MFIALTGTPGTGKSSVANQLRIKDINVINLNEIAFDHNFILGLDKKRHSYILDIESLNQYFKKHFHGNDIVFIEGHAAHLLQSISYVILLRCHPSILKKRLVQKGWNQAKIQENVDAETLDVILCETVDLHPIEHIFEIDTTDKTIESVTSSIQEIVDHEFHNIPNYNIGNIDWSEEILKES